MAKKKPAPRQKELTVLTVPVGYMKVVIEGITPLMIHRIPTEEEQKELKSKSITPERMAHIFTYWVDEKKRIPGIKAGPFKQAIIFAVNRTNGKNWSDKTMYGKDVKPTIFIEGVYRDRGDGKPCPGGDLVRVETSDILVDSRFVTLQGGAKGIMHRPYMPAGWRCELMVSYVTSAINADKIPQILTDAGVLSGVGVMRPERGWTFGQFRLLSVESVKAANAA